MLIDANLLRDPAQLSKIPNDKPGYYKWWATKKDTIRIFDGLGLNFSDYKQDLESNEGLYCIYVGIAIKESIRDRLDWHINDRHNKSAVKNRTLSTLRQSIASVIAGNQYDKEATNSFIDKLKVEYVALDFPIKSEEAKVEIHRMEKDLLGKSLRVLNIQENHHAKATEIKKKLRQLRKSALKMKGI